MQKGGRSQTGYIALLADQVKREDYAGLIADIKAGRTVGKLMDDLVLAWAALGEGRMSDAVGAFDTIAKAQGLEAFGLYHKALALASVVFGGAVLAVVLTLMLARGVQQTLRLLLAGVVVGVVLGALASLVGLFEPQVLQAMQGFMLGSTSFVGWTSCALMGAALVLTLLVAWALARVLDALTLGEATAQSLGVPLRQARLLLVAAMSLATAAAVAQMGLIAFVGLAAPHAVRSLLRCTHVGLLLLSALMGGALLLLADVLARGLLAPQDLPVGVLTAVLGGVYLLWRMKPAAGGRT